jgi:thioredoxin-like negative regulator of GroEL
MMFERIVVSMVLVGAGIAAFQLLLFTQQRWATVGSKREARTDRAALLVFTSPTCAPCKLQQLPIIERLMVDWRDKIDVDVVDVSERPEVASQYGVWSVPTTIVLDAQRNVIAINQGVANGRKLREQFEKTLSAFSTRGEQE